MRIKITPSKVKIKAIDYKRAERAIRTAVRKAGQEAIDECKKVVETWEHKPTFEAIEEKDGIVIVTNDQVFHWLDEGTKGPYTIAPRRAKALRFRGGYTPKTTPGHLGSGQGGASGDVVFMQKPVTHPGIKPRNFSEWIHRKTQNTLPVLLAQELGGVLGD